MCNSYFWFVLPYVVFFYFLLNLVIDLLIASFTVYALSLYQFLVAFNSDPAEIRTTNIF